MENSMFLLSSIEAVLDHLDEYQDLSYTLIEYVTLTPAIVGKLTETSLRHCIWPEGLPLPDVLDNCLFIDCQMAGLAFTGCSLFSAHFVRCDLSGSRFEACDLSAAYFLDCRLDRTEFQSCDMESIVIGLTGGTAMAA